MRVLLLTVLFAAITGSQFAAAQTETTLLEKQNLMHHQTCQQGEILGDARLTEHLGTAGTCAASQ